MSLKKVKKAVSGLFFELFPIRGWFNNDKLPFLKHSSFQIRKYFCIVVILPVVKLDLIF